MQVAELFTFIKERHTIYMRRKAGAGKPWTKDPILQAYRFCNVFRELDTQTLWFSNNWRTKYEDHDDLWFASLVFRFINWHETAVLFKPLPWKPADFIAATEKREAAGAKVYSGAYMISTHGVKQKKSRYIALSLNKVWQSRAQLRYKPHQTLAAFHAKLLTQADVGSFMAGQVIADCKYAGVMKHAQDWWTFAASGPGSRRGLNRVLNRPVQAAWIEGMWKHNLWELKMEIDKLIEKHKMPGMHAQDLQNCLCEFDKYERVRLGEGQPKAKYPGLPTTGE